MDLLLSDPYAYLDALLLMFVRTMSMMTIMPFLVIVVYQIQLRLALHFSLLFFW